MTRGGSKVGREVIKITKNIISVNDEIQVNTPLLHVRAPKIGVNTNGIKLARELIKSPSDTTLYTPGLRKSTDQELALNQISNFVENIRLEQNNRRQTPSAAAMPEHWASTQPRSQIRMVQPEESLPSGSNQQVQVQPGADVRQATDKILLDAERFKASLVAPKGMNFLPDKIDDNVELLRKLDDDDDFFHVSCHIDENLRAKIAKGDFVELDRLLPKEKSVQGYAMDDIQRLELMVRDGHPYFSTRHGESGKVSNIRKWDHAFRVYTTIYVQSNPHRAGEIMQYMHVIHTAAANYSWESVSYYDFMFRHLMAAKPWRSWAKKYNQGWNLALRRDHGGNLSHSSYSQGANQPAAKRRDWKEDCCWKYNNNKCNKGNDCKYDHRRTYCGAWNHSFYNCRKRKPRGAAGNKDQSGKSPKGNNWTAWYNPI